MSINTGVGTDVKAISDAIYRDGIIGLPDLLSVEWADQLDQDLKKEFMLALSEPGGSAPRGWNRFYFEPYPERIRGFLELVSHPTIMALSKHMFGEDYMVVELGSDIPLPGAKNQPWHRDFPMPDETRNEKRLTSIAINASSVDVTPDMGPFQIVPGTHFELGDDFDGGMFPPEERASDYESRMESRLGKRGSVSIRSGLALHRGSKSSNRSRMRPVAIVGIVSPDDRAVQNRIHKPDDDGCPRLRMSEKFVSTIPAHILKHLSYEIVADVSENLPRHFTHHTFEGLKMSELT